MANFDQAFDVVLGLEGGYVDHPADPGGATNYGISIRYLLDRGDLDGDDIPDGDIDGDGDIDVDDIRAIKPADAKHLYHTGFWVPNQLQKVRDNSVATKIFDMAVNMGSRQAWRLVQRAYNEARAGSELEVDGVVGPKTLAAINSLHQSTLFVEQIRDQQREFYQRLIAKRPSLVVFENGWMNRVAA